MINTLDKNFYKGVALCADWADLAFGKSFPKAGKNFFHYVSLQKSGCGWRTPLVKGRELLEKAEWEWKEGSLAILEMVYLTATYALISFREVFRVEINGLSKIEWIGDAAYVPLKIEKIWTKWGKNEGCLATFQSIGSGFSITFSVIKLFGLSAKKSTILAWLDVSLSTALFLSTFFETQDEAKNKPK